MNEHSGQTLDTGYWCPECEWFESIDQTELENENCGGCGCPAAAHVVAEVVGK